MSRFLVRFVLVRQHRFDLHVGIRSTAGWAVFHERVFKMKLEPSSYYRWVFDCCVFVPLICFQPRNGKRIDAEARRLIFGRMITHKVPAWNPCGWFWGCCYWQQLSEVLAGSYYIREKFNRTRYMWSTETQKKVLKKVIDTVVYALYTTCVVYSDDFASLAEHFITG